MLTRAQVHEMIDELPESRVHFAGFLLLCLLGTPDDDGEISDDGTWEPSRDIWGPDYAPARLVRFMTPRETRA